jgi:hypothetical protein
MASTDIGCQTGDGVALADNESHPREEVVEIQSLKTNTSGAQSFLSRLDCKAAMIEKTVTMNGFIYVIISICI